MTRVMFTNPPLMEVLLGIQLQDIGLSSIHFGLYWQTIRERFPLQMDIPAILLGDENSPSPLLPRALFRSSDNSALIQLQDNFFSHSWSQNSESKYLHFKEMLAEFKNEWFHFQEWYKEQKIGEQLKPLKYELTYLNLLNQDSGWSSPADSEQIFTFVNSIPGDFLGAPYSQDSLLTFGLPNNDGMMVVELDQRTLEEEDLDFLLFRLTTISFDSSKDLTLWFQEAHDYMVRSFLDLTKEDAHKKWGLLDE